jgi:hypothetical protein
MEPLVSVVQIDNFTEELGENPIMENEYDEHLISLMKQPLCSCLIHNYDCKYCNSKRARKIHLNNIAILKNEYFSLEGENRNKRLQCFVKISKYYSHYWHSIDRYPKSFYRVYNRIRDMIDTPEKIHRITDNHLRCCVAYEYFYIWGLDPIDEMIYPSS